MKIKILCDNCKREFECDDDILTNHNGIAVAEIFCPDCEEDLIDLNEYF